MRISAAEHQKILITIEERGGRLHRAPFAHFIIPCVCALLRACLQCASTSSLKFKCTTFCLSNLLPLDATTAIPLSAFCSFIWSESEKIQTFDAPFLSTLLGEGKYSGRNYWSMEFFKRLCKHMLALLSAFAEIKIHYGAHNQC